MEKDIFDQQPHTPLAGVDEARYARRDADARQALVALVVDEDSEVEPERRDGWKRRRGPDGDGREQRKNLAFEALANCAQLTRAADARFRDANALVRKSRLELLAPELILSCLQRVDRTTCLREGLCRCAPVGGLARDAGVDVVVQLGHTHSEELVQVRRCDSAVPDAFEQR